MNIPLVNLHRQYLAIKDEIDEAVGKVISRSAFIGGEFVGSFAGEFASYLGVSRCITCGNGTDALTIALYGLGIGEGDEVIVPAMTFAATAEAVIARGAVPVFADVDVRTGLLDPRELEKKSTSRTVAVIPVHLYGQPAPMEEIRAVAASRNLKVIEDAAQAHGAEYHDRKVGAWGDAAVFSFYPGKNLGAYGDGGAVVTDDEELAEKMRLYADHGRSEKYDHLFPGINSRLDGLQAAVLSVKLKYLDEWNRQRRKAAAFYDSMLEEAEEITPLQNGDNNTVSVRHLYVVRARERDGLKRFLRENGIAASVHYPLGLPFLSAFASYRQSDEQFPATAQLQESVISLPLFPEIREEEMEYVVDKIKEYYSR